MTEVKFCCHAGIPKKLLFDFCSCEEDALQLMKFGYWPATPSRPTTAFSFSLMDWLEALMLECQVSVHDFSQAVKYIIEQKFEKVSKSCLHDIT